MYLAVKMVNSKRYIHSNSREEKCFDTDFHSNNNCHYCDRVTVLAVLHKT